MVYWVFSILENCEDKIFNDAMKDKFFIEEIVNIAYPPQHFAGLNRRILDYLEASDTYTREEGFVGRASSAPLDARHFGTSKRLPAYKGPKQKLHLKIPKFDSAKSTFSSKSTSKFDSAKSTFSSKSKSKPGSKSKSKSKKPLRLEDFIPGEKKTHARISKRNYKSSGKKPPKQISRKIKKSNFNRRI